MKLSGKKLQVQHFPQVPCKPFCVDVKDEFDAYRIGNILADQHCFLFNEKFIPDYANAVLVMMWDEETKEWVDYYNDNEQMDWTDFETVYEDELIEKS